MTNKKEMTSCENLLSIIGQNNRNRMIENPNLIEEIMLESIQTKKETQARLDELKSEANILKQQRMQIDRFKDQDNIQKHLKKAIDLFSESSSLRKHRLIQMLVPKIILDEKEDQVSLFIDPFFEKSRKNGQENFEEFASFLPQNRIQEKKARLAKVMKFHAKFCHKAGKKFV